MKCRHRPGNFRIINLNPFRPKGTHFIDRRIQTRKKCGKGIEMKHPVWFTVWVSLILIVIFAMYLYQRAWIEMYFDAKTTFRSINIIRLLIIALILLWRFAYLLAGWKATILDNPPPITWPTEDEK